MNEHTPTPAAPTCEMALDCGCCACGTVATFRVQVSASPSARVNGYTCGACAAAYLRWATKHATSVTVTPVNPNGAEPSTPNEGTGNRYRFIQVRGVRLDIQVPWDAGADPQAVYDAVRAALLEMPRFPVPGGANDTAGIFDVGLPRRASIHTVNYASDL